MNTKFKPSQMTRKMKAAFYEIKKQEKQAVYSAELHGIEHWMTSKEWAIVDGMRKMFSHIFKVYYHDVEMLWISCGVPDVGGKWEILG